MRNNLVSVLRNLITTFFITLTLAWLNYNNNPNFLAIWLRSWLIAGLISNLFSLVIYNYLALFCPLRSLILKNPVTIKVLDRVFPRK